MRTNTIRQLTTLAVLTAIYAGTVTAGDVAGLANFTGGSKAKASEVNGNFSAVKTAVDDNNARIAALEAKIAALEANSVLSLDGKVFFRIFNGTPEVNFDGVNVKITNGEGITDSVNGVGNLIIGYDTVRETTSDKTGSHNLVVGDRHNYSSTGGLVAGFSNTVSSPSASVSGGDNNTASATYASVSGGSENTASDRDASVSGGRRNNASGPYTSVSGGLQNTAASANASVSGGKLNIAGDINCTLETCGVESNASVSGGESNIASGQNSSVSGGFTNIAGRDPFAVLPGTGKYSSVSGGRDGLASGFAASISGGFDNNATGDEASVSGGDLNTASGDFSSVSGGESVTADGFSNWKAGTLSE